jgi:hypothetical protein
MSYLTLQPSAEQTPHGQIWSLHFVAALRRLHVARLLLCHSLDRTSLSPGIASGWEQRFMPCSHSRRSSLLLATNRAPIICFPLTGNARCLVTCCPAAGLSIEKGQGRRTCCSFLCCLLVFHSWSRPPFFSLLLIYLSCVTFTPPRTIEQTLRLPSHDHRLNCLCPAMPQLPPSTRPQHQTPKPCLRNQNT